MQEDWIGEIENPARLQLCKYRRVLNDEDVGSSNVFPNYLADAVTGHRRVPRRQRPVRSRCTLA